MPRRIVVLPEDERLIISLSAAECYPQEAAGYMLSYPLAKGWRVHRVKPFEKAVWLTGATKLEADDHGNFFALTQPILDGLLPEDWCIGGYHSHPSESPTPSKMDQVDLRDNHDGPYIIVSISPGKRRAWSMRFRAYEWLNGRHRRLRIMRHP